VPAGAGAAAGAGGTGLATFCAGASLQRWVTLLDCLPIDLPPPSRFGIGMKAYKGQAQGREQRPDFHRCSKYQALIPTCKATSPPVRLWKST